MKVGIVSDTHDKISNWEKALLWMRGRGVEKVIHCGDVSRPGTLRQGKEILDVPFFVSLGNADLPCKEWGDGVFDEVGEMGVGKHRVAFVHRKRLALKLARGGGYSIVFHGHTHRPGMRSVNGVQVVCPGNLAGFRYDPTFAFWDTDDNSFELKILKDI